MIGRRFPPVLSVAVGGGFALAGLRLFLPTAPLTGVAILLVWLAFALGIGYGIASAWALPLAVIPFLGIWYTRATGPEYLGYGDASWLAPGLLILAGSCAIGLGMGLHRWALRAITWHRDSSQGSVEILLLAPILGILLLGAALDRGGRRAFVSSPRPIEVRRYSDGDVRAAATALPFAVYGVATEGSPGGVSRQTIAPPGWPPTEIVVVSYCDVRCHRGSEVQIQSAPPGFHLAAANPQGVEQPGHPQVGTPAKMLPSVPFETVEIAGRSWRIVASGPLAGTAKASADLDGASVQIYAPSRAIFARVATGLRQLAPVP